MQRQTAYKFELKVRSRQQRKLKRAGGCCRYVWNQMLGLQKSRLDWNEPILLDGEAESVLAFWKRNGKEFLYNAPSQSLQQVVQFQVRAIFDAFNPERLQEFPVFKKRITEEIASASRKGCYGNEKIIGCISRTSAGFAIISRIRKMS